MASSASSSSHVSIQVISIFEKVIVFKSKKKSSSAIPKDPNVVSNQQEEDDIAKAIQPSLQESKASSSQQPHRSSTYSGANAPSSNQGNSSLYPSANAPMDLGSFLASTSGSSSPGNV